MFPASTSPFVRRLAPGTRVASAWIIAPHPVCSSNGTTYDNECVFQREMCHLRANFTVYHPGDCTGMKYAAQYLANELNFNLL